MDMTPAVLEVLNLNEGLVAESKFLLDEEPIVPPFVLGPNRVERWISVPVIQRRTGAAMHGHRDQLIETSLDVV